MRTPISEVSFTTEYVIGKAAVEEADQKDPPSIWLMLPVIAKSDVSKALRLVIYSYRNYWSVYAAGPISRVPLNVNLYECIYDRITGRGRSAQASAQKLVEDLSDYRYYNVSMVQRYVRSYTNLKYRKTDTFESYIASDMTEKSAINAWFAARLMSVSAHNPNTASPINNAIAATYYQCKVSAEERKVPIQSP